MKTGIIYCATNLINGKQYIGQTINSLDERIKSHYKRSKNKFANEAFMCALRKHKKENWRWEILVENVPIDQLDLFERSYIWGLSAFEFGYNLTTGGTGGRILSEESRRKMSISRSGLNHPNFGKPLSEETKRKISIANMGRKGMIGKNHPMFGKTHDKAARKKISVANTGENHPNFGKHISRKTKNKISDSNSKNYKIIKPSGDIEIIKNLSNYCKENNLSVGSMCSVCDGKRKQHKGYQIERLNDKEGDEK